MNAARFERPRLAVVKIGSSSLRAGDGRLDRERVHDLADQLVRAREAGTQVVLVSSGAVAAGLGLLGFATRPRDLVSLQAAASVGQGELIHEYQVSLLARGVTCAQILLTQDDFLRRTRYLNARSTLRRLLELGALPVVNENDVVATEELSYGDNDHLAALVASMLEAQVLVLLSDVEGLFDADPRRGDATLVSRVDDVETVDPASLGGAGSFGTGGMRSKVEAARVATASDCHTVVASAAHPDVVAAALDGAPVGTWFVARTRRLEARRLWIGYALTPHGRVHIDAGAARAVAGGRTSLLAVGVTGVDGAFSAGDAIEIVGPDGAPVARGLSAYDAPDLQRIAGRTTSDAVATFGSAFGREVVHRDDLVPLHA